MTVKATATSPTSYIFYYLVLASNERTQALNHLDAVHFGHLEVTKQQVNWATLHLHPCILKH